MMKKQTRPIVVVSILVAVALLGILVTSVLAQPPSGGRRGRPRGGQGAVLDKDPVPKDDNEERILAILDDIRARQHYQNVPPQDGRLLRLLVETMNAKNVVEVGASTGYSAIWMGMGLQKTGGKLTTYEIDSGRAATARANFERAGMADVITLVLGDAHEKVTSLKGPIDLIFLDADKQGYVDYLNKLLPRVRPGGLIVAHNITPGMADPRYMEAIQTNPNLETIVRTGVSLTLKKH